MTQEDAENERTRGWRANAGRFLTAILIVVLVVGILLFLFGVLLTTSDPLFAEAGGTFIGLGLVLVFVSIVGLVARS